MTPEDAQDTVDAAFEEFGVEGRYFAPDGAAVDCLIVRYRSRQDREKGALGMSFGGAEVRMSDFPDHFLIRKSEVAQPEEAGRLEYAGAAYALKGAPVEIDTHRLVWCCGAEPQ